MDLLTHFAAMVKLMLAAAIKGSKQSMGLNASTLPPSTQHDLRRSNLATNFVTRCSALCCCCSCTPFHAFPHPRTSLVLLRALVLSDITPPVSPSFPTAGHIINLVALARFCLNSLIIRYPAGCPAVQLAEPLHFTSQTVTLIATVPRIAT